jgi:pimeloyl-ACP methyl ester carboxylesterase
MLREVITRAASRVDEAVGAAMFNRRSRASARAESLGPGERMRALEAIASVYDLPEHYDPGGAFFAAPPAASPRAQAVRALPGGQVVDWRWPSAFAPHAAEVADRYLASQENRTAVARLYLHDRPRPAAILLHGYRCGQWALEERVWPVSWLYERGLDVAIAVLPFHAVRAPDGPPRFPSSDPRITIEGFRQAVIDLRALAQTLRARGAPAVGAMGMSLGGYTASLLATVEPSLDFAVPMIPLASMAALARDGRRLVGSPEEQAAQLEAIERVFRPVSPFARPPSLGSDRVLVIGAAGDRITPIEHARSLAAHFEASLHVLPGGHLLQIGRADGFRAVGRMLARLGLLAAR